MPGGIPAVRPMRIHRRIGYLLIVLLAVAFAAAYALHRDFYGLYCDYMQSEEEVRAAHVQAEALESTLDRSRQRVHDLDSNPLEKESAIRRTQHLVRPGEKVFQIEESPTGGSRPQTQDQTKP